MNEKENKKDVPICLAQMGRKPESLPADSLLRRLPRMRGAKQVDNYKREKSEWNNLVEPDARPSTAAVETAVLTVRAMLPFTRAVEIHGKDTSKEKLHSCRGHSGRYER